MRREFLVIDSNCSLPLVGGELVEVVVEDLRRRLDDAERRAELVGDHRHEVALELVQLALAFQGALQLLLGLLAFRNVGHDCLHQVLVAIRNAAEHDIEGDLVTVRVEVGPLEAGGPLGKAAFDLAFGNHLGTLAVRLKLGGEFGRMAAGEVLLRDAEQRGGRRVHLGEIARSHRGA